MKGCKKCRQLLVQALYDELAPEEKGSFERHVASCPGCAAEFKALTETLRTMNGRARSDPGREFWDGYWDRLAGRLEKEKAVEDKPRSGAETRGRTWSLRPRWAFQAAAALALVVAGIFVGRLVFSPRPVSVEASRPAGEAPLVQRGEDDLILRARSYVDRSKLVLLALVNHDPASEDAYALDLPLQKQVSRQLVKQAGELKSDLKDPGQSRLRELVADLETILLQIANLEAENDFEAVEFVKQGVENGGLLLKINLSEMGGDLRDGRKAAAQKSPSQETKT
jgi:hypothetical protein